MAVLRHFDATTEERAAYMKHANAMRRALGEETDDSADEDEDITNDTALSDERLAEMGANEQYLLTIANDGLGKRTSSYAYPVKGRGGKGVVAQTLSRGKGEDDARLVRSFVVEESDQVMLATNGGKLIRTPVETISIVSRSSKGVRVIRTAADEDVVSVERIADATADDGDEESSENAGPNEK
jgi:DNA gyrase subunit A